MPYLVEIIFLIYSIGIAYVQAQLFNYRAENGDGRSINHALWAGIYTVFVILVIWAMHGEFWHPARIWEYLAALLIRFCFFGPALNIWRKYPSHRGAFYINPQGKALFDRIVKTPQRYFIFWLFAMVALGYIQLLIA